MKKYLALVLCLLMITPCARAEKRNALPPFQQMTQTVSPREYIRDDVYVLRTYPNTANDQVDEEIRNLIDGMAEKGREYLPKGKTDLMPGYLDVGANIFRTGEKWMSFLAIARIAWERQQTYVDFDARVFDMETGKRMTLSHLFADESPAWGMLQQAVRDQLTAYFDGETPDGDTLEQLSSLEELKNTPFTLTPAKLSLHYRADALYPGRNTLMHVNLYYKDLRPYMTDLGLEITDNSDYKMVALTYDDGGARGASLNVMDQLRRFGANATFFVVGTTIRNNYDVLSREHDAGFAVQSHNYEHIHENITPDKVTKWKDKFDQALNAAIGRRPDYMRAPGGKYLGFVKGDVGLPMIHWSIISDDSGKSNVQAIANRVINNSTDGSVVLMHDLNSYAHQYTELILDAMEDKGYLFVTVDELFAHYGISLEPNTLYYSCEELAEGKDIKIVPAP